MSQAQPLDFDLRVAIFPFTTEGECMHEVCYCKYCDKCTFEHFVTWIELSQDQPEFWQEPYGMRQISCHNPACIKPVPPETNFL